MRKSTRSKIVRSAGVLALFAGLLGVPAPPVAAAAPPGTAEEYLALSASLLAQKDLDAAEKTARRGLARHADAQGFHLRLGEIHLARNRHAEAFYELQWELLRAGSDAKTGRTAAARITEILFHTRGAEADEARRVLDTMRIAAEDPKTAIRTYDAIRAARGERFFLVLLLAEAKHAAGDRREAARLYDRLMALDGGFVPAYLQRARIHRESGEVAAAARLEARAKNVDPEHWSFAYADER